MFEHFYPDELQLLLPECLRMLKPGSRDFGRSLLLFACTLTDTAM